MVQAARGAGLIAERDYLNRSLKSQFKTAAKLESRLVVTLGEKEVASGQLTFKNQANGQETTLSLEDLLEDFVGVFRRLTMDTSVVDAFFKGE